MDSRTSILLPLLMIVAVPLMAQEGDPRHGAVALRAGDGWNANLVYEGDSGIWTVRCVQLLERYGCPEIIGLDDRGRCTILVSYSGKWTPLQTVEDGAWLGALAHDDVDPAMPGPELYVGGKLGNLYRILPHRDGGFDCDLVARVPGEEIHTLVSGDLDPARPGAELLLFTGSGQVHRCDPPALGRRRMTLTRVGDVAGRVRDARVLDDVPGRTPAVITAMRTGALALLRLEGDRLVRRDLLKEPMGLGRLARRRGGKGASRTFYVTRDDGLLLRLSGSEEGGFEREVVHAGPQGPRGVASGRFSADPDAETIAVFGYSGRVELLERGEGGRWSVSVAFEDRDKGHWLGVAELDGRNGTDELIASGYGRRIVLLSRPPGYGLPGVAVSPGGAASPARREPEDRAGGAAR